MALIQATVPDDVKAMADKAFARSGLTTPYAVRIMVTQVAATGRTPFDGLFATPDAVEFGEDVRRAMVLAEAQELGIVPDDSLPDPTEVPAEVLAQLGLAPEEVGMR